MKQLLKQDVICKGHIQFWKFQDFFFFFNSFWPIVFVKIKLKVQRRFKGKPERMYLKSVNQ